MLTVVRNGTGRIDKIRDAVLRELTLTFNGSGQLESLTDSAGRAWTLAYTSNRLSSITYPAVATGQHTESFAYDASNRIQTLTDRDGDAFTYTYQNGKLYEVTDPAPFNTQKQRFEYVTLTGGVKRTDYTDRRNLVWKHTFNAQNEFTKLEAPDATDKEFGYDSLHNLTNHTNELNKTWEATYDTRGNLLLSIDPLGQHNQRVWSPAPLNNLVAYRDADSNLWLFEYNDATDPTNLTKIIEPSDGYENPPAETLVQYYPSSDTTRRGLPHQVIDANGSATIFDYDFYGQLKSRHEGVPDAETVCYPGNYCQGLTFDAVGRLTGSSSNLSGHNYCVDDLGRTTCAICAFAESGGGQSAYLPPRPTCDPAFLLADPNFTGTYTPMSLPATSTRVIDGFTNRVTTNSYDQLGRQTGLSVNGEWGGTAPTRAFTYTPNSVSGQFTRVGPDSVTTQLTTDNKYRPETLSRTDGFSGSWTYYDNDQVSSFNGATGVVGAYTYDDAERTQQIKYTRGVPAQVLLQLDYTYNSRDLVTQIVETDELAQVSTTTFDHDDRGRLRSEARTGQSLYNLAYTYDQLGNRMTKVDALAGVTTTLTYDVSNPTLYGSKNNRLVFYEIKDTSTQALIETVWNEFDAEGKITRVIRKLASQSLYRATRMIYNTSKQVEYVIGEQWTPDGQTVPCNQYSRTYVWRFRYDGARQRYLRQRLNPADLTVLDTSWSDYDGNDTYTDFQVVAGAHITSRAYEPEFGEYPDPANPSSSIQYYQRDLIGTTRTMTCDTDLGACTPGPGGQPPITRRRVYTAFGEVVSTSGSVDSRYRYAGAWGYGSDNDFTFVHVGARWYDPETGRFLQRDPIGIKGGLNVYAYTGNQPSTAVDPTGLVLDSMFGGVQLPPGTYPRDFDGPSLEGVAAVIDGIIPCVDPLGALGAYGPGPTTTVSHAIGEGTSLFLPWTKVPGLIVKGAGAVGRAGMALGRAGRAAGDRVSRTARAADRALRPPNPTTSRGPFRLPPPRRFD